LPETEHPERRQHKRIPFINEVEVVGVGMHRCEDLSVGGLYLETVHAFPLGTLFDLQFKLRNADEHSIKVQARMLYRHEGVGAGLSFVGLNREDREKIVKFIEQR
jgi:PilZ domain